MIKKSIYTLILSIIILSSNSFITCAQDDSKDQKVNYSNADTWLLGYFDKDDMLIKPHNAWFDSGYDEYVFDDEIFMSLAELPFEYLEILIVLGTWCPDSRREVPRFMKIMDAWGFPEENIRFLGVDSYKQAPIDAYADLNIERVPTFIIYNKKNEEGRIIEYPKASLERDMLDILSKIPQ